MRSPSNPAVQKSCVIQEASAGRICAFIPANVRVLWRQSAAAVLLFPFRSKEFLLHGPTACLRNRGSHPASALHSDTRGAIKESSASRQTSFTPLHPTEQRLAG